MAFGAELTFETAYGCAKTTPTGPPDVRTASKLTLAITTVHERPSEDVFRLLGRVFDDRSDLFETVHVDCNRAASTPGFAPVVAQYVAASEWGERATSGAVDSFYDYERERLLV